MFCFVKKNKISMFFFLFLPSPPFSTGLQCSYMFLAHWEQNHLEWKRGQSPDELTQILYAQKACHKLDSSRQYNQSPVINSLKVLNESTQFFGPSKIMYSYGYKHLARNFTLHFENKCMYNKKLTN